MEKKRKKNVVVGFVVVGAVLFLSLYAIVVGPNSASAPQRLIGFSMNDSEIVAHAQAPETTTVHTVTVKSDYDITVGEHYHIGRYDLVPNLLLEQEPDVTSFACTDGTILRIEGACTVTVQ